MHIDVIVFSHGSVQLASGVFRTAGSDDLEEPAKKKIKVEQQDLCSEADLSNLQQPWPGSIFQIYSGNNFWWNLNIIFHQFSWALSKAEVQHQQQRRDCDLRGWECDLLGKQGEMFLCVPPRVVTWLRDLMCQSCLNVLSKTIQPNKILKASTI